jgi:hypothetical protein
MRFRSCGLMAPVPPVPFSSRGFIQLPALSPRLWGGIPKRRRRYSSRHSGRVTSNLCHPKPNREWYRPRAVPPSLKVMFRSRPQKQLFVCRPSSCTEKRQCSGFFSARFDTDKKRQRTRKSFFIYACDGIPLPHTCRGRLRQKVSERQNNVGLDNIVKIDPRSIRTFLEDICGNR